MPRKKPAATEPAVSIEPAAETALHAVVMLDVAVLVPYANNSRVHSKAQVKQIAASIVEFGFTIPVLVDERNIIIAGHGRVLAAQSLGMVQVPCIVARGWSESQKRAYVIADNKLTENGDWDESILRLEMAALLRDGFKLETTGFVAAELRNLKIPQPGQENTDPLGGADVGKLLGLVDITIADPRHKVEKGDHYVLDGRHHLLCVSVVTDWPVWAKLLTEAGALFAPYPGVFVPFGTKAADHPLVMVQPDPYIAGHILDRYEEVHGAGAVTQVAAE